MNIAIATLYKPNYEPFVAQVSPNWEAYAARHGYGLATCCQDVNTADIGFEKIRMVRELMFGESNRGKLDAMMVIDADVIFTNPSTKIEQFLDESPGQDYLVTTGFNGLCNGTFIVRATEGGERILNFVLENKYRHNNEQDTIKYHFDDPVIAGRIKLYPHTAFGSMFLHLYPEHAPVTRQRGNWEPGDFVLHLPGLSLQQRLELIAQEPIRSILHAL